MRLVWKRIEFTGWKRKEMSIVWSLSKKKDKKYMRLVVYVCVLTLSLVRPVRPERLFLFLPPLTAFPPMFDVTVCGC